MATIPEALDIALEYHQAGQLLEAERIYREILSMTPDHPDVLHLLGLNAHQQGNNDQAVEHLKHAIQLDQRQPHFHNNLGELYRRLGRTDEALACFRRAIELEPAYATAHFNLGITWLHQGKLDEAMACFERALEHQPDYAEAHYHLGLAWSERGRLEEAIACFERAIRFRPDYAEAHNDLGVARARLGRFEAAVSSLSRAIQLRPNNPQVFNNLGTVWKNLDNPRAAITCYQRALELWPDHAEASYNLGVVLRDQGRLAEAVARLERAIELRPDLAESHYGLAGARVCEGDLDAATGGLRRALELKPDYVQARSTLLSLLQYRSGVTLAQLRDAHAEYDRLHAAPLRAAWRPYANPRDPERPLRLGFVSADFWRHPIGYFLIGMLENLDRRRCEVVCYSDRLTPDDMTVRFRTAATLWRATRDMADERLAEQIRADGVDILFDLAGHTAENRLLVFARKPAPIQITWAGYVGTTGLAAMDYLLADPYQVPPEAEPYHAERVLRMPDGYVCYEPPGYMPPPGPLPALGSAQVTFGSFNHPLKITPEVVACWARILRRLPQARLVLKYRAMDDTAVQARLWRLFAREGIADGRVELSGGCPHDEFLGWYHKIDVALDPFPYGGGLTTCEALWMGVPVVTCPGETFASRHSLSHLSNVGLTETIARDLDEYVERAVSLAEDLPRLAALRAGLRDRVARSPLCDGKRFAENLLQVLRQVWRQWAEDGA